MKEQALTDGRRQDRPFGIFYFSEDDLRTGDSLLMRMSRDMISSDGFLERGVLPGILPRHASVSFMRQTQGWASFEISSRMERRVWSEKTLKLEESLVEAMRSKIMASK